MALHRVLCSPRCTDHTFVGTDVRQQHAAGISPAGCVLQPALQLNEQCMWTCLPAPDCPCRPFWMCKHHRPCVGGGAGILSAAYMWPIKHDTPCVQVVCSMMRGMWRSKSAAGARLQVHQMR